MMELKEIKSEIGSMLGKVDLLIMEMDNAISINKKAFYFAQLKSLSDLIEKEMDKIKLELIEANVLEYFEDENLKVILQEGAKMSAIDVVPLYDDLKKQKRENDFVKVSKVSIKDLETLKDGNILAAKYTITTGTKTASVKVSKLSKDDLKKLEEMKKGV